MTGLTGVTTYTDGWRKSFRLFGRQFGIEHSTVHFADNRRRGQKYLERFILYFGFGTLRLHRFWAGDDDRAPHDHPWWFVTFPFTGYWETVSAPERPFRGAELVDLQFTRWVKPFRFHYRAPGFRHIVHITHPAHISHYRIKPVWTLVVTGRRTATWGFYPEPDRFVAYADWTDYCNQHNL